MSLHRCGDNMPKHTSDKKSEAEYEESSLEALGHVIATLGDVVKDIGCFITAIGNFIISLDDWYRISVGVVVLLALLRYIWGT